MGRRRGRVCAPHGDRRWSDQWFDRDEIAHVPFIATLATMQILYGVLLTYTGQQPIPGKVEWFTVFGVGNVGPIPIPTIIMLVMLLSWISS